MPLHCYMCTEEGSTVEHAPPKCVFPESKDLPSGVNYRQNLITVPACPAHNTARSRDDEYLMYVLPASIGSNEVGLNHYLSKVQRAIARKPLLADSLRREAKEVLVHDTEADTWFNATAVPFDMLRVNKVLEMNARALYFHHYGIRYLGKIIVHKNFLLDMARPEMNDLNEKMFAMTDQLFSAHSPMGSNPDVFAYKFERNGNVDLLEMTFYGKNKVLAQLTHDERQPAASEASPLAQPDPLRQAP